MALLTDKEAKQTKTLCKFCDSFVKDGALCSKHTTVDIVLGEIMLPAADARYHGQDCGPDAKWFSPSKEYKKFLEDKAKAK